MAKVRSDEVLGKALATDQSVIPRFTIKKPDGTVVAENATVELTNPVIKEGMPVDKTAMDECLSASGRAGGTKKALTLEQENFALFNGALVRIQLFDQLSGAATLDVNGTGARRIKTAAGEDPDGIVKDTWVDLIYSTSRDQYILLGGGGSSAALSQSINLLEEAINMKYCKVLTTLPNSGASRITTWLSQGAYRATCKTKNYQYFARIRSNTAMVEFVRIKDDTGEWEEFTWTYSKILLPNVPCNSYVSNGNYTSYIGQAAMQRGSLFEIVPIRNSDHIIFHLFLIPEWVNYNNTNQQAGRYIRVAIGILFDDFTPSIIANTSQDGGYYPLTSKASSGVVNGYCTDDGHVFIAYPSYSYSGSTYDYGSNSTPCNLSCFSPSTRSVLWTLSEGSVKPSYSDGQYGCSIWVIDGTKAVAFTDCAYDTRSQASQVRARCWTYELTPDKAPTAYTQVGNSLSYGCSDSPYQRSLSWCVTDEEVSLLMACQYAMGSGSAYSYVIKNTYNITKDTFSYGTVPLLQQNIGISNYFVAVSGYTIAPYMLHSFNGAGGSAYASGTNNPQISSVVWNLWDASTNAATRSPLSGHSSSLIWQNVITPQANASSSYVVYCVMSDWRMVTGIAGNSGCCNGDKYYGISADNVPFVVSLSDVFANEPISWEAPEDGIYKLIAVGGGAAGTDKYGGGAGYLLLTTFSCQQGDILKIMLGRGELRSINTYFDVAQFGGLATGTQVDGPDGTTIVYAPPGNGNQGGATGAATPSGGGAGGYDLVQYGGQGMNFVGDATTSFTVSSTAGSISTGSIALSKDRNGGVSANAGAVTSGDGFGAGGGMNQNGKDGCLVIIR